MLPNDKAFQPPELPADFPLAGVPGVNQAIDPAVMNQVRTLAHSALDGVLQWAFSNVVPLLLQAIRQGPHAVHVAASKGGSAVNIGFDQAAAADDLMTREAGAVKQAPKAQVGPFPHGDVDLRFMGPNVAQNIQPNRGQGRRFYFLDGDAAPKQVPQKAAADNNRRPGAQPGAIEIIGFRPG
jgi:hypothetical protein